MYNIAFIILYILFSIDINIKEDINLKKLFGKYDSEEY